MKSSTLRFLAFVLLFAMFFSVPTRAYAAWTTEESDDASNQSSTYGITNPYPDLREDNTIMYYELFSMHGEKAYDILTTRWTGGEIVISELPSGAEYLIIEGTFYHSMGSEANMRAGFCWYDSVHHSYVPVSGCLIDPIVHGEKFQGKFPISNFGSRTYYPFVSNRESDGYVYGDATVYYSYA